VRLEEDVTDDGVVERVELSLPDLVGRTEGTIDEVFSGPCEGKVSSICVINFISHLG
jgi:hypothetical protein